MARRAFTLIELVVVMAIILAATVLVVASFRGESATVKLDNGALDFESWSAGIRYRAAELGRDFVIHYDYGGKTLSAAPDYSEEELEKIILDNISEAEKHQWQVPADCTIITADNAENTQASNDELEVFRFFPDGGGHASHILVLKCENLAKSFDISFLTGRLIVTDEDASLEYNGEKDLENQEQTP